LVSSGKPLSQGLSVFTGTPGVKIGIGERVLSQAASDVPGIERSGFSSDFFPPRPLTSLQTVKLASEIRQ